MADQEKLCPKCGKKMVIRKNRKSGQEFWGCSNYPNCTYCEPLNANLKECPKCKKKTLKTIHYKDKYTGKPKVAEICDLCGYKNWNAQE